MGDRYVDMVCGICGTAIIVDRNSSAIVAQGIHCTHQIDRGLSDAVSKEIWNHIVHFNNTGETHIELLERDLEELSLKASVASTGEIFVIDYDEGSVAASGMAINSNGYLIKMNEKGRIA